MTPRVESSVWRYVLSVLERTSRESRIRWIVKVPGGQGVGVKGRKVGAEVFEPAAVDDPGTGTRVMEFDRSEVDPDEATAEADFARGCCLHGAGCCWDLDLASGFLAAGGGAGSLLSSSRNNDS